MPYDQSYINFKYSKLNLQLWFCGLMALYRIFILLRAMFLCVPTSWHFHSLTPDGATFQNENWCWPCTSCKARHFSLYFLSTWKKIIKPALHMYPKMCPTYLPVVSSWVEALVGKHTHHPVEALRVVQYQLMLVTTLHLFPICWDQETWVGCSGI